MAKYEKWLGAGLGFLLTGNPLGGILGFVAGTLIEGSDTQAPQIGLGISEFEMNLIVLSSHLIKIDGRISIEEINFTRNFFNNHFDAQKDVQRTQVIHHCLQKEYDLNIACGQIRINSQHGTCVQVVRFLLDLAMCDGQLSERESYFIFRIAGYLNVNDVEFRKLREEHTVHNITVYEVLGVNQNADFTEIRSTYRRLVLKYHPDRNKDASEEEKKKLAQKFQQIQEAYEKIKTERGED